MAAQHVGVYAETAPGERRVALAPDTVGQLRALGFRVLVETGAGRHAYLPDASYANAGALIVPRTNLLQLADVLVGIRAPNVPPTHRFRAGQILMCLLRPQRIPLLIRRWAEQGVTAIAMDLAPDTAPQLGALASQERIAGYQAALTAADTFGRCLPVAEATDEPAAPPRILVLGTGPAGRQAAHTARRLGATVDVREAVPQRPGELAGVDIAIVTAGVANQHPPLLIPACALRDMRPGSVAIDTTVDEFGRAVEFAEQGAAVEVEPGVTVIGDGNLASRTATSASAAYAAVVTALLTHLVKGGRLAIELSDPALAAMVVTHGRDVVNDAVWRLIVREIAVAGLP